MKLRYYINENDIEDDKPSKSPVDNNEDDNPNYKVYTQSDINNEYVSSSSDSDNSKDDELSVASSRPGIE